MQTKCGVEEEWQAEVHPVKQKITITQVHGEEQGHGFVRPHCCSVPAWLEQKNVEKPQLQATNRKMGNGMKVEINSLGRGCGDIH